MFLRPCCRWRQCWVPGEQCQMIQTKLHRQESQIFNSTTGEQTGYIVVWKGSLKEVAVLGTDSLVGTHKTRKTKILDFFLFTFWHCSQCNQYKAWKRQVLRYDPTDTMFDYLTATRGGLTACERDPQECHIAPQVIESPNTPSFTTTPIAG